jgi:hypothetical protein
VHTDLDFSDPKDARNIRVFESYVTGMAFSGDGETVAVTLSNNRVRILRQNSRKSCPLMN